jgi:hypothetical protein
MYWISRVEMAKGSGTAFRNQMRTGRTGAVPREKETLNSVDDALPIERWLDTASTVHAVPKLSLDAYVEVIGLVIRESFSSDEVKVPKSQAEQWLSGLCDLAKTNVKNVKEVIQMDIAPEVTVVRVPAVQNRTEFNLSDGTTGDSGETNDGGSGSDD